MWAKSAQRGATHERAANAKQHWFDFLVTAAARLPDRRRRSSPALRARLARRRRDATPPPIMQAIFIVQPLKTPFKSDKSFKQPWKNHSFRINFILPACFDSVPPPLKPKFYSSISFLVIFHVCPRWYTDGIRVDVDVLCCYVRLRFSRSFRFSRRACDVPYENAERREWGGRRGVPGVGAVAGSTNPHYITYIHTKHCCVRAREPRVAASRELVRGDK